MGHWDMFDKFMEKEKQSNDDANVEADNAGDDGEKS